MCASLRVLSFMTAHLITRGRALVGCQAQIYLQTSSPAAIINLCDDFMIIQAIPTLPVMFADL